MPCKFTKEEESKSPQILYSLEEFNSASYKLLNAIRTVLSDMHTCRKLSKKLNNCIDEYSQEVFGALPFNT